MNQLLIIGTLLVRGALDRSADASPEEVPLPPIDHAALRAMARSYRQEQPAPTATAPEPQPLPLAA